MSNRTKSSILSETSNRANALMPDASDPTSREVATRESLLRTELKVEGALRFLDALELDQPSRRIRAAAVAGGSAVVDAGSLVAFTDALDDQQKADVQNSVLLAQLAASKKYDRDSDTENWYKFYRSVLEQVGWVVPTFSFSSVSGGGSRFTVDDVVIQLLQAIATSDEITIVEAAINALKDMDSKDHAVVIFETNTHGAANGNFQIQSCNVSPGGTLVMNVGAFYFSTSETVTRVLFFNFPSNSTSMFAARQTMDLDENVYAQVRDAVSTKLGDRAVQFVSNLDI